MRYLKFSCSEKSKVMEHQFVYNSDVLFVSANEFATCFLRCFGAGEPFDKEFCALAVSYFGK